MLISGLLDFSSMCEILKCIWSKIVYEIVSGPTQISFISVWPKTVVNENFSTD
jgi:hypothetical protein